MNDLGGSPNHVWIEGNYIYVVNSIGNTLQILRRVTQGSDTGLDLTTIAELHFGPNGFPQAIAKVGSDAYVSLFGGLDGSGGAVARVDVSDPSSPALVETIAVVGDSLYAGDVGGRVFVVQNVDNQLIERRGYDPVALGPPLAVCPSSPSGFGAVSDIIAIP